MRLFTVAFLSVSLGVAACNRPTADAPANDEAITTATAATTGTNNGGLPPVWREETIPAGTALPVILDTTVGSDISRIEEPVQAHLTRVVSVGGEAVLPAGTRVNGVITDATRSGKVSGRAHVSVRFDSLVPPGSNARYQIDTAAVERTAAATKKKDALEIGGPAAGGALIGALLGGKKGALIGTAVGGGTGTAVVLSTRGKEIHLASGMALTIRLTEPVTIRVGG